MIWIWDAVHKGLEHQPWYYNINRAQPYPNFPNIHPDLHRRTSVKVDPYGNTQHIKVLKHIVYIWYGCGMQSTRVWSLNHDITTSLGLNHTPIIQKFTTPDLHRHNSVRVDPYVHSQHIKVLIFLYTYDMDGGCSLWGFGASTMTLQHHSGSDLHQLSKN